MNGVHRKHLHALLCSVISLVFAESDKRPFSVEEVEEPQLTISQFELAHKCVFSKYPRFVCVYAHGPNDLCVPVLLFIHTSCSI